MAHLSDPSDTTTGRDTETLRQVAEKPVSAPPITAPEPPTAVAGATRAAATPAREQAAEDAAALANAAYGAVAGVLPGVGPGDVLGVRESLLEPGWAVVRLTAPGYEAVGGYHAVFLRRDEEDRWRAERSVLVEDRAAPRSLATVLGGVPRDLTRPMLDGNPGKPADTPGKEAVRFVEWTTGKSGWEAGAVESRDRARRVRVTNRGDGDVSTDVYLRDEGGLLSVVAVGRGLTANDAPHLPPELVEPSDPVETPIETPIGTPVEEPSPPESSRSLEVIAGVDSPREPRGLDEAVRAARGYGGVVGFWAVGVDGGPESGYGVRPDEPFFAASVIKLPVMISVFRRIEAGDLRLGDRVTVKRDDYAQGAGALQWEKGETDHNTVEDLLWMMMTESDNVATNALVRTAGGPNAVNEVARSLGTENTVLRVKVTSERAAIPSMDNQTTPRDMATLVRAIASHEAANADSCRQMLELMRQNNMEWWMEAGVPGGVPVANKGGWLSSVYNDAGVVFFEDEPYVLATFSMYGPRDLAEGNEIVKDISRSVFLAQSGRWPEEYEKEQRERKEREERREREKLKEREERQRHEEELEKRAENESRALD